MLLAVSAGHAIAGWLLAIVAIAVVIWALDSEEGNGGIFASVVALAFFGLLAILGIFNLFAFLWHHPWTSLTLAVIYFAGGAVWVWAKWSIYIKVLREQLEDEKQKFLEANHTTEATMTESQLKSWNMGGGFAFSRRIGNDGDDLVPKARRHKAKIIKWMTYWPFSMVETFFNDAIKRFWHAVWHTIHDELQRIANRNFENANFKKPEVKKENDSYADHSVVGG